MGSIGNATRLDAGAKQEGPENVELLPPHGAILVREFSRVSRP